MTFTAPEDIVSRREDVRQLRLAGRTVAQIAVDLGWSERVINRDVKALGLTRREIHPRLSAEELARAEELLGEGMPYKAVADILGRSPAAIANNLPGRGWDNATSGAFGMTVRWLNKTIDTTWRGVAI